MSLWGNKDLANNSPIYAPLQVNLTTNTTNQTALFGNTTVGAFLNNGVAMNQAVGLFGVDSTEAANTLSQAKKVAHAGWNLRIAGVGPLTGITVAAAGRGYTNADTYSISAGTGGTNQTGNLVTNATGNVVSYSVTTAGANFQSAAPTVTITTGAGTGASITATAGGRAGRVQMETLVALGSLTGDSDNSTM